MNIGEAIEWNKTMRDSYHKGENYYSEKTQAHQLGVEALERQKVLRGMVRFNTLKQAREAWKYVVLPLPSETYIPESIGVLPSDE